MATAPPSGHEPEGLAHAPDRSHPLDFVLATDLRFDEGQRRKGATPAEPRVLKPAVDRVA
jgi:hypothetical protein